MTAFQKYFVESITKRYAKFSGRARRSEYWYFLLFQISIVAALIIPIIVISNSNDIVSKGLFGTYVLFISLTLLPQTAVTVRRLHDSNKSGWLILLSFLPFGVIVLLILALLDSDPNRNKYGPNPKAEEIASIDDHLIQDR